MEDRRPDRPDGRNAGGLAEGKIDKSDRTQTERPTFTGMESADTCKYFGSHATHAHAIKTVTPVPVMHVTCYVF